MSFKSSRGHRGKQQQKDSAWNLCAQEIADLSKQSSDHPAKTAYFRCTSASAADRVIPIQAIREEDLKRSEAQLDQAIGFLAKRKVDCIIVGGGPIFREKGIRGELEFIDRVTRSTGIPT